MNGKLFLLNRQSVFLLVFFLVNLLLSSWFIGTHPTWNPLSRALSVICLCEHGTLQIDRYQEQCGDKSFVNEHYYSDKAPFPAFFIAPFYCLLEKAGLTGSSSDKSFARSALITGGWLAGSLPFAIMVILLFLGIRKINTGISPVLLSALPFYGSFIFIYAGTFFSHVLTACLLLIAYILLKDRKRYFLAGCFSGLALLSEYPAGIVIPVWALQLFIRERNLKNVWKFIASAGIFILILMVYNYLLTGSPLKLLYQYVSHEDLTSSREHLGFGWINFSALYGMIIGQFRGLLFYMPVLIPLAVGIFIKGRSHLKYIHLNYAVISSLAYFLVIASHELWWGGWCYGPRHLLPLCGILVFEGIRNSTFTPLLRTIFGVCTLSGLLITWMAKSTFVYSLHDSIRYPLTERIIPLFSGGYLNPDNLPTMIFEIEPGIASHLWISLFTGLLFLLSIWFRRINDPKPQPDEKQ